MDLWDWIGSAEDVGSAAGGTDWWSAADAVGNTAADFAGADSWDWGSLVDGVGNAASEFTGGLGLSFDPSADVKGYGFNAPLPDMPSMVSGIGDSGGWAQQNYVSPEVTAEAGVPAYSYDTMTPNERAARLAATQRATDGMGGQRLGAGVSNPTGSAWDRFVDKGKTALQDPMTYARLGLALAGGAGQAPVSPRNTQAGYNAYTAEDAAARAENAGLRTQQNNTTRNLQESAGPDAYRAGVTRAANQTEALRKNLGYTNAPTFVKDALVAKQNAQGQLGAQTAYTSAQAAANKSANYLMAPGGNAGLVTAGMNLDRANLEAQNARQKQYAPIGTALESVFGTAEEDARRKAAVEGP